MTRRLRHFFESEVPENSIKYSDTSSTNQDKFDDASHLGRYFWSLLQNFRKFYGISENTLDFYESYFSQPMKVIAVNIIILC